MLFTFIAIYSLSQFLYTFWFRFTNLRFIWGYRILVGCDYDVAALPLSLFPGFSLIFNTPLLNLFFVWVFSYIIFFSFGSFLFFWQKIDSKFFLFFFPTKYKKIKISLPKKSWLVNSVPSDARNLGKDLYIMASYSFGLEFVPWNLHTATDGCDNLGCRYVAQCMAHKCWDLVAQLRELRYTPNLYGYIGTHSHFVVTDGT